ncbi:hypothetical protein ACSSS7_007697 [Eimeria intestinalis]
MRAVLSEVVRADSGAAGNGRKHDARGGFSEAKASTATEAKASADIRAGMLRHYIDRVDICIRADHAPLEHIPSNSSPCRCLHRWALRLYDSRLRAATLQKHWTAFVRRRRHVQSGLALDGHGWPPRSETAWPRQLLREGRRAGKPPSTCSYAVGSCGGCGAGAPGAMGDSGLGGGKPMRGGRSSCGTDGGRVGSAADPGVPVRREHCQGANGNQARAVTDEEIEFIAVALENECALGEAGADLLLVQEMEAERGGKQDVRTAKKAALRAPRRTSRQARPGMHRSLPVTPKVVPFSGVHGAYVREGRMESADNGERSAPLL